MVGWASEFATRLRLKSYMVVTNTTLLRTQNDISEYKMKHWDEHSRNEYCSKNSALCLQNRMNISELQLADPVNRCVYSMVNGDKPHWLL
jgi:hypothetical protein